MNRFLFLLVAFFFNLQNANAVSNRLNPTADYALINGNIHTMDADGTVAQAIAVEEDEIVYVGGADGLGSVIGIGTKVIDLKGKMVLPGFVDGHSHPIAGPLVKAGVDLQSDDINEIFARFREEVATNDADIILGNGVRFNPWTDGNPTAAMLDEIESDRPVYLWAIDGHAAWVNSKALEIAGITKDTPDTVPGYSFFERDADGNPTGWIVELPAQMQVFTTLVDVTPEFFQAGLEAWFPRFSAAGITAIHDLGVQGMGQTEGYRMLQEIETAGKLPFRVSGVYYWNDPEIDPLPLLVDMNAEINSDRVKVRYLKINLDGGDDKWNAIYVDGYTDKPDLEVNPIIPVDVLNDVVQRADAAGINVACHCFGDLAVRYLLDAVENAIEVNPPRDRRHIVSHGNSVHQDDIPRFAELGVTYDTSGAWMTFDPLLQSVATERLGPKRVQEMFPMTAIAAEGGNVSLGSDFPAAGYLSEYRPLVAIEAAVTRTLDGRKDVPPLGGETAKIPIDVAVRAHTIGAAYGMGMDAEIGSLEVGKKADLVVLEKDIYEIDPDDISEVKVLYTIMDGELTYDSTSE